MIDTIKIACLVRQISLPEELTLLGWQWKYDENTGKKIWFYKEKGSKHPFISFYESEIGTVYLWLNVSLPAFFHGSNAKLLTEKEVRQALKQLSEYVTDKSGIEFDAAKVTVWNVHFTKDYFVGEDLIRPMITRLANMAISRFEPGGYGKTSCYHHSKGNGKVKKKPRTICLYGKHEDAIAKGFSKDDIDATFGILRAEFRYRDKRAVKRLCQSLNLPNRHAETIFTNAVAEMVLAPIERQIFLLQNETDVRNKIYKLIEVFGKRHARTLIAFLSNRDIFGADFYKIKGLGYSRSYYFACERECRKVGIWNLQEESQIPIVIDNLL
jgi:hypothetical protein